MSVRAYYNEIDPYAAQWLRNLMKAGHISDGEVDERSILDVKPSDLRGFDRCHFFAGIGVWDYSLALARWPEGRPVWTGSCPCQPFSAAGRGGGFDDERHLWPAFFHLIGQCRPATVLGEQVASKVGLSWLDLVQSDLEGEGYAVGAADLCAAGVGAPHIRQRLWFVADSGGQRFDRESSQLWRSGEGGRHEAYHLEAPRNREAGIVADANGNGQQGGESTFAAGGGRRSAHESREIRFLADADDQRHERNWPCGPGRDEPPDYIKPHFWSRADWLPFRDGKARPVEPGTFPLAHGAPARVGRLRAYGNAINAETARVFIEAVIHVAP